MLSELMEGIADLAASGLLWVGVERARRKADRSHPFGYGRELYFWTLLAALLMFGITASFSIYFGIQRFLNPSPIQNLYLAFAALLVALVTNGYAFSLSLRRLLKHRTFLSVLHIFFRSSLVETKTTFTLDLMGTTSAFIGLISLFIYSVTGDGRFDGLGAISIGVTLGFLAYLLILSIKDLLVGKTASVETESRIRQATLSVPAVKDVLDLKTMHIGSERLLVNLEVHLDHSLTTREIEKLIDEIKQKILEEVPTVRHIQVELETP